MARKRLPARRPKEIAAPLVRNRSARSGGAIRAIVIHTTECRPRNGIEDLMGVRAWFDNPRSQASSHVIIDNGGQSVRCVPDDQKAWTCAAFNSATLNIELVGWASTPRWRWLRRRWQLRKCAQYLAFWSAAWNIPLRMGQASAGGSIIKTGVLGHMHLGAAGGGHHDPGPDFPFDVLLRKARYFKAEGWPA